MPCRKLAIHLQQLYMVTGGQRLTLLQFIGRTLSNRCRPTVRPFYLNFAEVQARQHGMHIMHVLLRF